MRSSGSSSRADGAALPTRAAAAIPAEAALRAAGLQAGVALLAAGLATALLAIGWLALPVRALADAVPTAAPTLLDAVDHWSFDPTIQVPAILSALAYLYGVRLVRARHPGNPVPLARTLAFLGGLVVIEIATQGPIDYYEATLFSVHMAQHLLLMMVAAPLLVMGAPITLLLRVAPPDVRNRRILPLLHSRPLRVLTHPLVASAMFAGALWVSHFSPIYELALENDTVHNFEHLAFLVAALLFWWPMVGRDPGPWHLSPPVRLAAMLLQMAQGAFLGVAIMNARAPLYAHYADLHLAWIRAIDDQQLAGAIMWGAGGVGFLVLSLLVFYEWMRTEEQAAARVDARLDREARAAASAALTASAVPTAETEEAAPAEDA